MNKKRFLVILTTLSILTTSMAHAATGEVTLVATTKEKQLILKPVFWYEKQGDKFTFLMQRHTAVIPAVIGNHTYCVSATAATSSNDCSCQTVTIQSENNRLLSLSLR